MVEKEHPHFRGHFGLWSFAISKYIETYNTVIQFSQFLLISFLVEGKEHDEKVDGALVNRYR